MTNCRGWRKGGPSLRRPVRNEFAMEPGSASSLIVGVYINLNNFKNSA
jgi:hypothetical protein